MKNYFFIGTLLFLSFSCTKNPEACLTLDSDSILVGDTVRMTSCSENAVYYDWHIDEVPLSSVVGITGGLDYTVLTTGEDINCATYVDVVFNETGTFNMRLEVPKLKSGTCNSDAISFRKVADDLKVLIVN